MGQLLGQKHLISLRLGKTQDPHFEEKDTLNYATRTIWYRTPTFKTVALPALFIGYGLSVTGNHGLFISSQSVQSFIVKTYPGFNSQLDNYLQFSPAVLALGLKASGVKTEHTWVEGLILYAASAAITEGVTEGLKYTVHEMRPNSSDYFSFPSGHTSIAFQGAEFLHQEYINQSCWYSVAGYGLATSTAALRMLNNEHWFSDVLVGAGIGILSTRLAYLVYPALKKKFIKGKTKGT